MAMNIQLILENDQVALLPLQETDFEALYAVAADPKIWEQHPNRDRWQRDVFRGYFEGAMESKGAYKIIDKKTGEIAGSTRYYGYNEKEKSIFIGYTFYATRYWGTGLNPMVKGLMLEHAFRYLDKVLFHVGSTNFRSQVAIGRVGAVKVGEESVAYYGEAPKLNFIYSITKDHYLNNRP